MTTIADDTIVGHGRSHDENFMKRKHHIDAAIDFAGGVAGGTASVYVGQPLDTVKVKMQTFPKMYKNAYHCFKHTYQHEGIWRGLYAGTIPSLIAQVLENSILFAAYGWCQKLVAHVADKRNVNDLNAVQNAFAGSAASFFSSIALCPSELIKCKLQAMEEMKDSGRLQSNGKRHGPLSLTRQIIRQEGLAGMFRGFVPTVAREMPGYFFFFGGYELSRTFLTPPGKSKDELGAVSTIISGGIGGVALWTAVFPADVVKSRCQVQVTSGKSPSFFPLMISIARNEGIRALYHGLGPTLMRTVPATGALFLAVESTKRHLHELLDDQDNS